MEKNRLKKAAFDFLCYDRGDTFFTCGLYALLIKADNSNREKLRQVHPYQVAVFELWQEEGIQAVEYLAKSE